jgi:hypothetical protein
VFGLVAGMERFVVRGAGLPHFPEDFEPALAEAAQGAGVALAFGAMSTVVGLCPRAGLTAVVPKTPTAHKEMTIPLGLTLLIPSGALPRFAVK